MEAAHLGSFSWPHPFLGTSNPSNLTDSKWKFREDLQEDAGVPYVCQDETSIHIICGRMSHPDIRPNVFLSHDTFPVWKSHYFAISMCVRWCITVNESWRCGKKQEPFLASLGIFSKWQNYFTVLCHAKKMRNPFLLLFSDAFFFLVWIAIFIKFADCTASTGGVFFPTPKNYTLC